MFERFSTQSRRVVVIAQEESRRLGHNYIGTEHELLGLLAIRDAVVEAALGGRVTKEKVRGAIVEIIGESDDTPSGRIPFTPRAKKVLELSLREALRLRHRGIEPAHILLGLLREGEGVAAQVLAAAGVDFEEVRRRAVAGLRAQPGDAASHPTLVSAPDEVLYELRHMSTDSAAAALDRAAAGGIDGIPTPWSLLRAVAAGDDAVASLLEGINLETPASFSDETSGHAFLHLFQRAQGLASAVGPLEPVEGPSRSLGVVMARVDTPHLLVVLLSPGEGGVAGELADAGADPAALRRRALALL